MCGIKSNFFGKVKEDFVIKAQQMLSFVPLIGNSVAICQRF